MGDTEEFLEPIDKEHLEPSDNSKYRLQKYWDKRFELEEEFDWLCTYQELRPFLLPKLIHKYTDKKTRLLIVGCGNSTLSQDLFTDLPQDNFEIISSDYSSVVIEKMEQRYPHLKWVVSDCTKMTEFVEEEFDYILDKGVMDALITDEKSSWSPQKQTIERTRNMMQQVRRCLKSNGLFIQISFQQPHFRKRYLLASKEELELDPVQFQVPKQILDFSTNILHFTFEYEVVVQEKKLDYFVYTMQKK